MLPVVYEEIRTRKWPILILFCLCSLPFILIRVLDADKRMDYFIVGSLAIIALFYFVGSKMKIVLDNEGR
jgi:hypothetical protein